MKRKLIEEWETQIGDQKILTRRYRVKDDEPEPIPPEPPEPDQRFVSRWEAGLGTGRDAITDGGLWKVEGRDPDRPLLEVIADGPEGLNALRFTHEPSWWKALRKDRFWDWDAPRQLVSFYIRPLSTTAFVHWCQDPPGGGSSAFWFGCHQGGFYIASHADQGQVPDNWRFEAAEPWMEAYSETLPLNEWYRVALELKVVGRDPLQLQIDPKVYDLAGVMLLGPERFLTRTAGAISSLSQEYAKGHRWVMETNPPEKLHDLSCGTVDPRAPGAPLFDLAEFQLWSFHDDD